MNRLRPSDISARWRSASLKTSFAAHVAVCLVAALVCSCTTAFLFAHLQNTVTEDFSELSGLYIFDPTTSSLRQARTVWVASDDFDVQREVFVESARNENAAIPLSDLPADVAVSDATDYQLAVGTRLSEFDGEHGAELYLLEFEDTVAGLLQTELNATTLPSYDAYARTMVEDEAERTGSPSSGPSEPKGSLAVSSVGYYLFEPPSLGARIMNGVFGLLAFLMFPLWFAVCIWVAARRFFDRRLNPALDLLGDAAAKIAAEDLDFALSYPRNDEMGSLVSSFETMRSSLAAGQKSLWRTAEERRRLNAAFAHDLRTPLTVLHGTVEMMAARTEAGATDPERVAADCTSLARQIGRIESYVEAMAGIQRLEDRAAATSPIRLSELLADLVATGTALCGKAGVSFVLDGPEDIGDREDPVIDVDCGIVEEVAGNLVANAARYAAGMVSAHVAVEKDGTTGQATSSVVLIVSDDGPGFSARALRDGCLPFFSENKASGSFGLGLSVARLLCEKHGGTLSLANGEQGGARTTARFAIGQPTAERPSETK